MGWDLKPDRPIQGKVQSVTERFRVDASSHGQENLDNITTPGDVPDDPGTRISSGVTRNMSLGLLPEAIASKMTSAIRQ